ncbi:hypothetical protein RJT34_26611 [Clitoria ternatea]|uniref:Uncharacterized protein n=1 Tax=Clitoria ternatea TaxID=43366 RepID=A0AAN9I848_CLITE
MGEDETDGREVNGKGFTERGIVAGRDREVGDGDEEGFSIARLDAREIEADEEGDEVRVVREDSSEGVGTDLRA